MTTGETEIDQDHTTEIMTEDVGEIGTEIGTGTETETERRAEMMTTGINQEGIAFEYFNTFGILLEKLLSPF